MKHLVALFILVTSVVFAQDTHRQLWENEPFGGHDLTTELVERRDAFSKHFDRGEGTITAYIASGPINYLDQGKWKTIYHTITPSDNGFENVHNSYKTYYPTVSTGHVSTVLTNGSQLKDMLQMQMYYEINGNPTQVQSITSVQGIANFNELTYSGVYGNGIDLRLTQNTTGRKMDYIIHSVDALGVIPPGATSLIFEESAILPDNYTAELIDGIIYLKDSDGNVQAKYERPYFTETLTDNQEELDYREPYKTGIYEIAQNGNTLLIKTKVPLDWLLASERSFPVTIDPTITCYPDNVLYYDGRIITNNCALTGTVNPNAGEWLYEGIFQDGTPYFTQSVWVQFNTSAICDGATINSVALTTTVSSRSGAIDVKYRKLTNAPYTADNATRLNEIRGGSEYNDIARTATGNFNSTGAKTHTLGGTAAADLQSNLTSDWFAVGYHLYGAQTCVSYAIYNRHDHANKPRIEVNYTDPAAATATLTSQTATICPGSSVTLSGSVTASGPWTLTLSNGTQVSGTGSGPWSTTVTPTSSTTYSLSSLSVPCPPPTLSGTATITLPTPSGNLATNGQSATCVVGAGQTVHFYHTASGNYIATVTAGPASLGSTIATAYVDGSVQFVPACSMPSYETAVMQRHWVITPTTNGTATVRLPYTNTEFQNLASGSVVSSSPDDLVTYPNQNTVFLSKYSGGVFPATTNVNANPNDNCIVGGTTLHTGIQHGAHPVAPVSAAVLYSDFNIPGFSEFWLHGVDNNSPLSVTLSDFSGTCAGNERQIEWSTATEQNSDYFELERSRDGQQWTPIVKIPGAGTTTTSTPYAYNDRVDGGMHYYRLKQTDYDGAFRYYGPIVVNCEPGENNFSVFPNPSSGEFTIEINSSEIIDNVAVVVYDLNGKQLLKRLVSDQLSGTNRIYFTADQLASGTYLLILESSNTNTNFSPVRLIIH